MLKKFLAAVCVVVAATALNVPDAAARSLADIQRWSMRTTC